MDWKSFISRSCFALSLISWTAFMLWFSTELWVPLLFENGYHLKDGRGISFLVTIGVVASSAVFTVGIFVPVILSTIFGAIQNVFTRFNGREATATIIEVGPNSTGFNVETNDNPLLGLTLEINDPRHGAYVVEVDTTIPQYEIPQYQPGAEVNVIINKSNPKKVVVAGLKK